MHILAAIASVVGFVAAILWGLSKAAESGKTLIETFGDLRFAFRRRGFARQDRLESIDDARIAAAAMMVATAQTDGAMTAAERDTILRELESTIGCEPKIAAAMLANARWLVRDTDDLGAVLRKLLPLVKRTCGPRERTDLVRMLSAVAVADGEQDELVRHRIDRLTRELTR